MPHTPAPTPPAPAAITAIHWWRHPLLRLSWCLALAAALSPGLLRLAASPAAGRGPAIYPAIVATVAFALAGAFFIGARPAADSWDGHLARTVAYLLGFSLWGLGFLMVGAVFFG